MTHRIQPIIEGNVSKGGQNQLRTDTNGNVSEQRPIRPNPRFHPSDDYDLLVLRPTQQINLADGIPAMIDQVCIQVGDAVQYRCIWWNGRERKAEWINASELPPQPIDLETQRIGFVK